MRDRNQIRIIGGTHRSRKLPVVDLPGLRPTGDRIRETLFNWLQPLLPGAKCLDLFAGSGALGIEAASRGASNVIMLERAPSVARQLRENIAQLQLTDVEVIQTDTLKWLDRSGDAFDIIFLDPPFEEEMLSICCRMLENNHWLDSKARIYIETDAEKPFTTTPKNWNCVKQKKSGNVSYSLFNRRFQTCE